MSSPISSALAKLDDCLQAVQVQVEYLRSGLEVDDVQLTAALEDACQNAAEVRELIQIERSDANWNSREALDGLIIELEIAAHERRNQELRNKLLELADELEAGTVRHRSEARTTALNNLRQEAIQELRAEAAIPEQTKDLPGPEASEWLHWACNMDENRDADALQCLRTDFTALDQFAGEMEESYWTPGDRVRRSAAPAPASTPRRGPGGPAYTPPRPAPSTSSDYGRSSHNVAGRPEASQGPGYAAAVARAYDRPSSAAPAAVESRRPEPSGGIALVTEAPQAEPVKAPVPDPPARVATPPAQRTAPRTYPAVEKPKSGGNGAATANEVRAAAAAAVKPQATVVVTPVERPKPQQPVAKPVEKPADKQAEKKAKDRKQQQQQQQQRAAAEAAATAAAAAKAAEVARAKAAAEAAKSAKVAKVEVEEVENETWTSKWSDLKENGGEALADGKWQKYAFAPESLVVIALLLCLAVGLPMWMMHRKSASATPATAAQTSATTSAAITPAPTGNTPVPAAGTTAPNGKPTTEAQAKPQDQNAAQKPQTDQTQQRDTPTSNAQVISPAPEAPKQVVAKNEEPAGAEAPPTVGAASGATGGLGIMNVPASVPKLAGQKLRVSSGVAQGQLTHQVTPQYPSQARQEKVQGTVVLQAVIAKDGSVEKLSVVSGPSQLTKAAMEAVKQWRYRPFALNGEPVEADTQINVNFKLGE